MGMFTWDCKLCGHPLLARECTNDVNVWMNNGVAILSDGSVINGQYDGYGRLDDIEINYIGEPAVFHQQCYELTKDQYDNSPSRSTRDKGFNFEEHVHNFPEPSTLEEAQILRQTGDMANQISCNNWKIMGLEYLISSAASAYDEVKDIDFEFSEKMQKLMNVLKELAVHRDNMERKEAEKRAKNRGLNIETSLKIEEVLKELDPNGYLWLYVEKAEHVEGPVYNIYTDDFSYQELNLETKKLGVKIFAKD